MEIQCRMINPNKVIIKDRKPGDMFYADWLVDKNNDVRMSSKQYNRDWLGKREPLVVILPNGQSFMVDSYYRSVETNPEKEGWTVTGKAPNITLSPSINAESPSNHKLGYHGWLRDGILSADLEGRKY
ncbi:MAG: DUF6527 family protein [Bacilli bacterium]|nr:DUF6527 family protein [Bacilli bacterium]